jgi:uncharacterized membrane protein YraQ (UPF0718 family)
MFVPTIVMAVIAVALFLIATFRGAGENIAGLKVGGRLILEVLPLLIFAFIIAGLVQTILPRDVLSKWVGMESGVRGIAIGTLSGSITPGGPYVSLPVASALLKAGASVGTMVAFLTSWGLWAVARLPMEIGILGWKFTLIRIISTIIFPPVAGYIAIGVSRLFG